jgi:hypothetical protein
MKDILNIILIIIILIGLNYCMQPKNNNLICNKPITKQFEQQIPIHTQIPIPIPIQQNIITQNEKPVESFIDLDTKYISFDYNVRPIDKKFINDQTGGSYMYTWYPNTWIDKIDENGKPLYKSRDNLKDTSGIPKTSYSYDFNNVKIGNMSSVLKPEDSQGKTIKEIYDNSIIDYKSLGPNKNMLSDETSDIIMSGGSNLQYYTADTWTYENENQQNGGLIYDNVYGDDPMSNNVSVF